MDDAGIATKFPAFTAGSSLSDGMDSYLFLLAVKPTMALTVKSPGLLSHVDGLDVSRPAAIDLGVAAPDGSIVESDPCQPCRTACDALRDRHWLESLTGCRLSASGNYLSCPLVFFFFFF